MKSFLIAKATLLFLTSASVLAAQINLSNITTTNAVKTNDAILVNANLGGGVWATRTATKQAVFGDPFRITSLLADNATNVAIVVDTDEAWVEAGAKQFASRRSGTNTFSVAPHGGIAVGAHAEDPAFYGIIGANTIFQQINVPALGDNETAQIILGTIQDSDWLRAGEMTISTGSGSGGDSASISMSGYNSTNNISVSIAAVSKQDLVPHVLQVSQNSSPTFTVYPSGATTLRAVTIVGTTNQVIFGSTNAAPGTPGTISRWVSVQITGESTAYRIPLYE